MCKCTPSIRTPFCGKLGCEWPGSKPEGARENLHSQHPYPKYPGETVESMAEIGEAFMDALPKDYSWLQSPAEIIADLTNQRDEARTDYARLESKWIAAKSELTVEQCKVVHLTQQRDELLATLKVIAGKPPADVFHTGAWARRVAEDAIAKAEGRGT